MSKYNCTNPRCNEEFHSKEDKPIVKCPVCNFENLNVDKVINLDNFLWIESMFQNLQIYGKTQTFNMIDKVYHNATTRARVRKIYYETLKVLEIK